MGRSRCGHTIHRCESCFKKPSKIFAHHGRILVLQEICENCADGNIHMADVYYRYFGRKKKFSKH
ncbi:hypothetical protein AAVH_36221 [Aphelenchoides avenae]|nr:hypothetical protein AAVH_36221 [Aphelenchus avenae]